MCNRYEHIPYHVDECDVEVCPACNGEGGYEQAVTASRWDIDPPSEWRTCATCDGKPFHVRPYEPEGPVPPISADDEIRF